MVAAKPEEISDRLNDAHLETILAHELWHVRRRDNLAAALHMLVEAIFWFHPLVWWLGSRLVEARECACDEAVLESGSDRKVYAESILKICEFCVGSPLTCVSGVTGADLKKRIAHIMTASVGHKLTFSKKLLLGAATLAAVIAPILLHATSSRATSQTQNPSTIAPVYKVASVKIDEVGTASLKTGKGIIEQRMSFGLGMFSAKNISLQELIRSAYGVDDYQISVAPPSLISPLYDVDAEAEPSVIHEMKKLSDDQRERENRRMLQALLTDRFKLMLHRETKGLPAYSLVVAEPGKLHEATGDCGPPSDPAMWKPGMPTPTPPCGSMRIFFAGGLDGRKVPISQLAANLSGITKMKVLDKTNLAGEYDINLEWTPAPNQFSVPGGDSSNVPPANQSDPSRPTLLIAIQQQLGLKLESETTPVEILVIDHAEMASKN